jgi:hypothetical protein
VRKYTVAYEIKRVIFSEESVGLLNLANITKTAHDETCHVIPKKTESHSYQ